MSELISHYTFPGLTAGTTLIVLGAVHGDEVCGPSAIRRVMHEIDEGSIILTKGTLRCVPVSNPRAYEGGVRFAEDNLNRIFKKTDSPATYEAKLANELCELVDVSDAMLDIHSSHAPAPVNLFVDYPTTENEAFAAALGAEFAIYDWPKVYEQSSVELDSWTTDRYAFEHGKVGILLEAGQHSDPRSEVVAYEAILRTLMHFAMIAPRPELDAAQHATPVRMTQVFVRNDMADTFAAPWSHLERVAKGTLIATRGNGEEIRMEEDGVVIFPKTYAKPGGEWFYLGVLSKQ
jgi:predicted deacylase